MCKPCYKCNVGLIKKINAKNSKYSEDIFTFHRTMYSKIKRLYL